MRALRIFTATTIAAASLASSAQAAAPVTVIRSSARLAVRGDILYGQVRCQIACTVSATAKTTIKHKSKTIGTFHNGLSNLPAPVTPGIFSPDFKLKKSMAKSLRKRLKHHRPVNVTMTITVTMTDGAAPVVDVNTLPLVLYKDTVNKG